MNKTLDLTKFASVANVEINHEMGGDSVHIHLANGKVIVLALENDAIHALDSKDAENSSAMLGIDMGCGYANENEPYTFVSFGKTLPHHHYD